MDRLASRIPAAVHLAVDSLGMPAVSALAVETEPTPRCATLPAQAFRGRLRYRTA